MESPEVKRTSLDITSGSIDKRARAELDEIEQINKWNVQDPKDFDNFKEKLEKLAKPKYDSNCDNTFKQS